MSKSYLSGAEWVLKNDNFEYKGTLDKNGKADLNQIAQGTYDFTLSKKGYVAKTIQVVFGDEPTKINIDLEEEPVKEKPKPKKSSTKKSTKKSSTKKEEPKAEKKPKSTTKKSSVKKTESKTDSKKDEDKK